MIPPSLAEVLHELMTQTGNAEYALKNIVTPMEDNDDDYYYAHVNLLDMIKDVHGKLQDINNAAEKLTAKPNRP